ncbi:hypothetical protein M3Y94_01117200 [Aphelenchoides besseyi]|nr:hypothetical protein M3Y94_01117200 [Aphelenchoides besseyi]KAI6219221.1 hypothetical protein M3Y95_01116400 [Aphelenchoides besseyi]
MLNDTSEKLASIQSKIETINERLETGRLYSISSCDSESISVFERTRSLFRLAMEKQSFYAHFFKLLALFAIAVSHLVFMQSFLDAFTAVEDWSIRMHVQFASTSLPTTTAMPLPAINESESQLLAALINSTQIPPTASTTAGPLDVVRMRDLQTMTQQMDLLAEYKRNTWMTVAVMCIALCTSSYFLFILPITSETCKRRELFMGIIDLLSFAAVPVLLTTRIFIVQQLHAGLSHGMLNAHRIFSAERLMNILQCTILPRERLPYCSDIVLSTIFPIVLLKYLIILALLTLAYIALAYLIEWCIRHWFPHKQNHSRRGHSCCVCTRNLSQGSKSAYGRCPSMSSIRPAHHYNRAYQPVSLTQGPLKPIINPTALTSAPLLGTLARDEDVASVTESIPQEPRPNETA